MKKIFKSISVVLVFGMIIGVMVNSNLYVTKATQSRIGNFNKNFNLNSDGGNNIVNVALAQYEKTGSNLGYTEDWCADFVSDCAILAGVSDAIPASGGVYILYNNIINNGGLRVNSPRVGDIAFMSWSGTGGYEHVEIVYRVEGNTVYTVGGNSGRNTSSLYTSSSYKN